MAITLEMVMAAVTALASRVYSVVQVKKHVKGIDKKVTEQGVTLKDIKKNCLPTIERKIDDLQEDVTTLKVEDTHIKERVDKLEKKD